MIGLTKAHRDALRDFAMAARRLPLEDVAALLAGENGLHPDGTLESEGNLPHLAAFAEALECVLRRGYASDLDDGVLINLAPLQELVPWPRKREKVRLDKSLAIAHGLYVNQGGGHS